MSPLHIALLFVLGSSLVSCGGSGGSSTGANFSGNNSALHCVTFEPGIILNSCDVAIKVRTFDTGDVSAKVPANGQVADPSAGVGDTFGACFAPFIPTAENSIEFSCE